MRKITSSIFYQGNAVSNNTSHGIKRIVSSKDDKEIPIIAFCHLSWNWVWQRPQQFLSRISKNHPLLFVETYCSDIEESFIKLWNPDSHPRVTILEMHFPASRWSDGDFIDQERRRLMKEYLASEVGQKFQHPILWFNDPMAVVAFAGSLDEQMIVYDCMDELTQFKGAPTMLAERERELTQLADVIFCGGRAMRDKRLPLNPNCHFYGTGVDCDHFGKAYSVETPAHPLMSDIRRPVLGYFGVIDERIDYSLLAKMATAHPEWDLVMIGPFAKIDPNDIPRMPNIHWLGSQDYKDLPSLTKKMDVCLMPFALNEATEYINPTKALEYMAAGKMVVSTALQEVRSNFAEVCYIAESQDQFIRLCEDALENPSIERIQKGLKLSSENTWEAIANKMENHIQYVLNGQSAQSYGKSEPVAKNSAYV